MSNFEVKQSVQSEVRLQNKREKNTAMNIRIKNHTCAQVMTITVFQLCL